MDLILHRKDGTEQVLRNIIVKDSKYPKKPLMTAEQEIAATLGCQLTKDNSFKYVMERNSKAEQKAVKKEYKKDKIQLSQLRSDMIAAFQATIPNWGSGSLKVA